MASSGVDEPIHHHDLDQRMHDLLTERNVELGRGPHEVFTGQGSDARAAWEAFKVVAAMPVSESFDVDGEVWRIDRSREGDVVTYTENPRYEEFKNARGISDLQPTDGFGFSALRLFTYTDADGEYAGKYALALDVAFAACPSGSRLDGYLVGLAGPPLNPGERRWAEEQSPPLLGLEAWIEAVEHSMTFRSLDDQEPDGFDFSFDAAF